MSFRNRLTLFFVLIVVVPMVAVAFVLFRLIADNESGKADARLAATKGSAINLYREDYNRANLAADKRELARLEARRKKLVESIMEGVPGSEVKDELIAYGKKLDRA